MWLLGTRRGLSTMEAVMAGIRSLATAVDAQSPPGHEPARAEDDPPVRQAAAPAYRAGPARRPRRDHLEPLRGRRDPAVVAIVSSGYSSDPVMATWAEHGFAAALAKPYVAGELRDTLRDSLLAQKHRAN
jgi:hypothetical protein